MMIEPDLRAVVTDVPRSICPWHAGLSGRCPACGEGRLFGRFLKVADACEACGTEFHHHRADDLPPYIVIFIVGHLIGYGILTAETGSSAAVGPARRLAGPDAGAVPGPAPAGQRRCRRPAIRARHAWLRRSPESETSTRTMHVTDAEHAWRQMHHASSRLTSAPARPRAPPRDAATLIIIDRKRRRPKVLMGKRHAGLKFMPGKFVFPGGRIEPGDRSMPVAGALHPRAEAGPDGAACSRPRPSAAARLALAAIRETYEETGLLLGTRITARPKRCRTGLGRPFRSTASSRTSKRFSSSRRAITPPRRVPALRHPLLRHRPPRHRATRSSGVVGPDSELVELAWVTFAEAAALDLPSITRVDARRAGGADRAGFAPELPVPFYPSSGHGNIALRELYLECRVRDAVP